MAGKNLSRKVHRPWTPVQGCGCLSPGERGLNGEKAPEADESRGPPQRRGAARETALRLTARQPYRRGAKSAGNGA